MKTFKEFFKQPAATQTTPFDTWFAGSKVVDQTGKPLVVYHGTKSTLNQIKLNLRPRMSEPIIPMILDLIIEAANK